LLNEARFGRWPVLLAVPEMMTPILVEEQRQQEAPKHAVVAMPAAHRILQKRKVFQIAKTKAR
jgi:hypothetical protein